MSSYRLTQTGAEVQGLLDKVETLKIKNGTITIGEESLTPVTTETDPTVPSWAKSERKPSYELSELGDDSTHRTVTDAEKAAWNGKQDAIADLDDIRSGAGAGATAVQPSQMQTALAGKQDTLVSGTNIKTVNGENILGSGNIVAGDPNAVKYTEQTLTDAQKTQARTNIGAGTYSKPSGGIPETDLASAVTAKLNKQEIFIAEYDVTSYQDIVDAYDAGKIPFVVYDNLLYTPYVCDVEGGAFAFHFVDAESHVVDVVYVSEDGWDEAEYDIYSKPDGGIPEADLSSAVTAKLNKMDVFWAEPNATTYAELVAAANADKIIIAYRGNGFYSLTDFNSAGFWFYHINVETGYVSGYRVTRSNGWEQLDDFVIPSTTSIDEWDAKYDKPSGGIPKTDLASAVQTSLGKADTAYQKPATGIPETDLASAVTAKLNATEIFPVVFGTTSIADIQAAVASAKIPVCIRDGVIYVYAYEDTSVILFTCSAQTYAKYIRISKSNSQWYAGQVSLENPENKISDISANSTSTSKYPNAKAVADYIASKELSDLADVSDTAPTDGQALLWDGTNEEWKPGTVQGGGSVTDVTVGGTSVVNQQGVAEVPEIPEAVVAQELSIDSTPTENSANLVTSGGVYAAIQAGSGTPEVFWAEYGVTTYAEVVAAFNEGASVVMSYDSRLYILADTDRIDSAWFTADMGTELHRARVTKTNQWIVDALYPQMISDKVSDIPANRTSTSKYPNTKAVYDALGKYGVITQNINWTGNNTTGFEASTSNPVYGLIPQFFIDLVTAEGAVFNATTGYFELNGITDIAYDEMQEMYAKRTGEGQTWVGSIYYGLNYGARTCFPVFRGFGSSYDNHEPTTMHMKYAGVGANGILTHNSNLVIFALTDDLTLLYGANGNDFGNSFNNNHTLKKVLGVFNVQNGGLLFYPGADCPKLESFQMRGLKTNLNLSKMPSLNTASIAYMVNNAGTAAITITLHATAYARATADADVQAALAAHTNVTLASA